MPTSKRPDTDSPADTGAPTVIPVRGALRAGPEAPRPLEVNFGYVITEDGRYGGTDSPGSDRRPDGGAPGSQPGRPLPSVAAAPPFDVMVGYMSPVYPTQSVTFAPRITIDGTPGNDNLVGTPGTDTLRGLGGDDILTGLAGADTLDGGTGEDTASYAGSDAAVRVDLDTGTATGGHAEGDVFDRIENLTGSDHDDILTGDATANVLRGGDGGDSLLGLGGNDTLYGNDGNDTLTGGAGAAPGHDTTTSWKAGAAGTPWTAGPARTRPLTRPRIRGWR
jgi:Ca2+-binding RTX toxin-like protein